MVQRCWYRLDRGGYATRSRVVLALQKLYIYVCVCVCVFVSGESRADGAAGGLVVE